jgi:hypothetical protein
MHEYRRKFALCCAAALITMSAGATAGGFAPASHGTPFEGTDDFLFDPTIPLEGALAAISCVGTASTGNPLQPCPEGSSVRVRALPGQSRIETDDTRFGGVLTVSANADLDPEYAGPVWGIWHLAVDAGEGGWRGVWFGKRVFAPDPSSSGPGTWITDTRLIGYGTGSLRGLRVIANETVVTFTPIPVPYEALAYFGIPGVCPGGTCPPEGALEGRILQLHAHH